MSHQCIFGRRELGRILCCRWWRATIANMGAILDPIASPLTLFSTRIGLMVSFPVWSPPYEIQCSHVHWPPIPATHIPAVSVDLAVF